MHVLETGKIPDLEETAVRVYSHGVYCIEWENKTLADNHTNRFM